MKTTVISNTDNTIDWDKPQVVIFSGRYVLTNGENKGNNFSGTLLSGATDHQHIGYFSKEWAKFAFSKVTEPVTIKFENE